MAYVSYRKHVIQYLDDLIDSLVDNNYFSDLEKAEKYVHSIYDYYINNLHILHKSNATKYLQGELLEKHGHLCKSCTYRINKNTTWCAIYKTDGVRYIIVDVFNNHVVDYNEVKLF